ncbi:hypothetical protein [Salmonella enterica]|uniref:Uncharacterized protein n=7 Tax=Enterobacteriaceae TaxID=543 RepID=A0A5T2U1M2_SALER|nr:hypothetical protein [Salmonella enterica]AXD23430.1 hypothetical protein CHE86_05850 [Salmonella enterica]EAM6608089.1 hypothetical protein [Salmonella enterica]MEO51002.1 hypothetical protein [Salmonella enterica]
MSLQEYGFSRAAASELLKKYRVFVEFDSNDGLKRINVKGLLNSVGSGGLLKKEIEWLNI